MATVYDHIEANNRKTLLLVLLFPLSLCVLVTVLVTAAFFFIGDVQFATQFLLPYRGFLAEHQIEVTNGNLFFLAGLAFVNKLLIYIVLLSLGWMTIAYFFGDSMMMAFSQAKPLEKKENPQIYRAVENVAIAAGLPMPKVYVVDDESLNAFATGRNPQTAAIALTTGIIAKLEPLELEGVIAHEMAHIGNRDIRLNMLIITGLSIFGFLADMIRSHLYYSRSSNKEQSQMKILFLALFIALVLFNFVVAPIIRLAISRSREYAADATGALITRHPQALARALEKIAEDARVEVLDNRPTMSTACIADPREKIAAFNSLLATHPPIKKRIQRLMAMNGNVH